MESKRKNIYIFLFIITTIIASCIAVYFYITKDREIKRLNEELNKKVADEQIQKDENVNDNEKNEENMVEKYEWLNIDASNCLNIDGEVIYNDVLTINKTTYGLSCYFDNTNQKLKLTIDKDDFNTLFSGIASLNESKEVEFSFDKKVLDVTIGEFGQSLGDETLLFLMEDETVEYMHLVTAVKNDDFKSYGKIDNLENIICIKPASAGIAQGGGWITTVAFNKDGKFYDLGNILRDMKVIF